MGLDTVFKNASTLAFNVFSDLVVDGFYVEVSDTGLAAATETAYPVGIIFSKMSEDEVNTLSFKRLVQPTDSICLISGPSLVPDVKVGNLIRANGKDFNIVAHDIDPAGALWIILLRKP